MSLDFDATLRGYTIGQKVFSRYTLKRLVGRGGMGVVWLAHDDELDRAVALKFLPEVVAFDKESIAEFKRETRRNLELTHPHIVRIYDFVQDGQGAAISMEFVDGVSLSALKTERPHGIFPPAEISGFVRQLGAALSYAHETARVVHRDLKPANLLVEGQGRLKVTDFGIAASIADSVSRVSNQAGSSGTMLYMSPQQMMGEKPATTDDIYSLGATLYEMLTGKPPFYTGNVVLQVQSKVAPSMTKRREELGVTGAEPIPPEWEETVASCLAKDAARRPPSIDEVLRRLGLAESGETTPAAPVMTAKSAVADPVSVAASPSPAPEQIDAPKPPARKSGALLMTMAVVVLLILAGGFYFWKTQTPPRQEAVKTAAEAEPIADARAAEAEAARIAQEEADRRAQLEAEARRLEEEQSRARDEIMAQIAKVDPRVDESVLLATEEVVTAYLAAAPMQHRSTVEAEWNAQLAAWKEAHLPATLFVRTNPEGADVIVGERVVRSPAEFVDVPPGTVVLTISKQGFHRREVVFDLKPGQRFEAPVIALTEVLQPVELSSANPDVRYRLRTKDGRELEGALPVKLELPAGRHPVVYSRANYGEREEVVVVDDNPAAATVDLSGGTLAIDSTPAGARVELGGRPIGVTPLRLEDQPPGEFQLTLSLSGYTPATLTRSLPLGGSVNETIALEEEPLAVLLKKLDGYWAYAGGTIGVVSVLKISAEERTVEFTGRALWMDNSGRAPFVAFDPERKAGVADFKHASANAAGALRMFFTPEGEGFVITYEVYKHRLPYRRATAAEIRRWFPNAAAQLGETAGRKK